MPDEQDKDLTDQEEVPATPLHARGEGRDEDVEGDPEPEMGDEGDVDQEGPGNPVDEDDA